MTTELIPVGAWFAEKICADYFHAFGIKNLLFKKRSKFQLIEIVEHEIFGKMLFLDRKLQVAEFDEYIYHESLVHPAMLLHDNPRRVLIIGGGDGCALREVLKYKSVESVTLVDLDSEVISAVRKNLADLIKGAFDDERVKVLNEDGTKFVRETQEKFDVIIVDVTDPASGVSAKLFAKGFYENCKQRLKDGILAVQAEGVHFSHFYCPINFPTIVKTLQAVFKHVFPYATFIPTFADAWGFAIASDSYDFKNLSTEEIKKRVEERNIRLTFLSAEKLRAIFTLSKDVKERIEKFGMVVDDEFAEKVKKDVRLTYKYGEKLRFDKLIEK